MSRDSIGDAQGFPYAGKSQYNSGIKTLALGIYNTMMENFINPPRIPTDSKAFRVPALIAFVLATHGQALERFCFLALKGDFL